jgi:hypothetical protein
VLSALYCMVMLPNHNYERVRLAPQ